MLVVVCVDCVVSVGIVDVIGSVIVASVVAVVAVLLFRVSIFCIRLSALSMKDCGAACTKDDSSGAYPYCESMRAPYATCPCLPTLRPHAITNMPELICHNEYVRICPCLPTLRPRRVVALPPSFPVLSFLSFLGHNFSTHTPHFPHGRRFRIFSVFLGGPAGSPSM